jgi:hypothetical protein
MATIDKFTDQTVLAEIAQNDGNQSMRMKAVRQLTDQAELANVAKNDTNQWVRLTAVARLTVQTALAEIAQTDSVSEVRWEAVKRLTDQTILAKLAMHDRDLGVRQAAMNKITDQKIRSEIAKTNTDESVRRAVSVPRMSESEMLEFLREFCSLLANSKCTKDQLAQHEAKVREIGDELYSRGGEERMKVALRQLLNIPQYRRIEVIWSGIGNWRG